MKVGVLSNNFPPEIIGGAEVYAKNLTDELSNSIDVFVLAGKLTDIRKYTITPDYTSYTYPVYRINLNYLSFDYRNFANFFNPFILAKVRKIFKKENPEVFHLHNLAGISFSPLYSYKKIPTIMTLHDFWLICPKNTLLDISSKLCTNGGIKGCVGCEIRMFPPFFGASVNTRNKIVEKLSQRIDIFIAPSNKLKQIMDERGYGFEVVHVPYGMCLDRFIEIKREYEQERVNVLMMGNIAEHKGVYVLLDAMSTVLNRYHGSVSLTLAGVGAEKPSILKYLNKKNINEHVKLVDWFNSEQTKIELLKKADIFVLPSIWFENLPLTITEAMASALPVIGSNIGGIPEMVTDNKTGYLFEVGDSTELAEKIEELIISPEKRKRFGNSGRKKAQKDHELKTHVEKILNIYRSF